MKDLLLILIMLCVFMFGYFVMERLDRFIEKNQRLIADGQRSGQSRIRIAAENARLLEAVAPALQRCSGADPHLAFFLSRGRAERILERLMAEQIDIVLLDDAPDTTLQTLCASLRINCDGAAAPMTLHGLPVETLDACANVWVVWKRDLHAKDRDRVIFALENEQCCAH